MNCAATAGSWDIGRTRQLHWLGAGSAKLGRHASAPRPGSKSNYSWASNGAQNRSPGLKLEQQPTVSPERIYLYVYADKRRGGTLHRHLRSQKKQRKRYGGYLRRGQTPNRTSIDKRPQIVARKGRFGDWEADTIVGARHKGGILSAVERKSKLTRLRKLASKAAAEMKDNTIALLAPLAARVHTITVDNGGFKLEVQRARLGLWLGFLAEGD